MGSPAVQALQRCHLNRERMHLGRTCLSVSQGRGTLSQETSGAGVGLVP